VPNVVEIWEPKPPGALWATPGLLRDSFTFTFYNSFLQNSKIFLFIIWLFHDAVLSGNDGVVIMNGECVPEQVTDGLI
jgi:hypothetical protein